jgi:lactate dehydrogenase-like 2-hydroxyacid dehydrogenase
VGAGRSGFRRARRADPGIATTTLFGKVRADLIERLPALEIIASFGVGTTTWTSPPPCKPARS